MTGHPLHLVIKHISWHTYDSYFDRKRKLDNFVKDFNNSNGISFAVFDFQKLLICPGS